MRRYYQKSDSNLIIFNRHYSSTEELPPKSIFKNNLDMTVAIARNMELFIKNLDLGKDVYVYGMEISYLGQLTSVLQTTWKTDMITKAYRQYNTTKKQKSMTVYNYYVRKSFLKIFGIIYVFNCFISKFY